MSQSCKIKFTSQTLYSTKIFMHYKIRLILHEIFLTTKSEKYSWSIFKNYAQTIKLVIDIFWMSSLYYIAFFFLHFSRHLFEETTFQLSVQFDVLSILLFSSWVGSREPRWRWSRRPPRLPSPRGVESRPSRGLANTCRSRLRHTGSPSCTLSRTPGDSDTYRSPGPTSTNNRAVTSWDRLRLRLTLLFWTRHWPRASGSRHSHWQVLGSNLCNIDSVSSSSLVLKYSNSTWSSVVQLSCWQPHLQAVWVSTLICLQSCSTPPPSLRTWYTTSTLVISLATTLQRS